MFTGESGERIVGDRYHRSRPLQVSVKSLDAIGVPEAAFGSPIDRGWTRRNITIAGGSVPRDPGSIIRIGDVVLEVVRVAAPCKLLDDTIGVGAQHALRHRGGSICRVLEGGRIVVGAEVATQQPAARA